MKYLILLLATLLPTLASAQLVQSCRSINPIDYLISYEDLRGRNAWARKCGYISSNVELFLSADYMYVTFTDSASNLIRAPVRESEACINNLIRLAFCYP